MKSSQQFKDNAIVKTIRNRVIELCSSPDNKLLPVFYDLHLKYVEEYALQLAQAIKADYEIVVLAALLHDISAVYDFTTLANHANHSADYAEVLLKNAGLPEEKINHISHCIRKHTNPILVGADTPESVCLSNADAMALIAAPTYWLYFAFATMKMGYPEGFVWYKKKVFNNWDTIIHPASEIIYDSYLKTSLLFEKTDYYILS